jgi:hypothetical protein
MPPTFLGRWRPEQFEPDEVLLVESLRAMGEYHAVEKHMQSAVATSFETSKSLVGSVGRHSLAIGLITDSTSTF